jgi:hypothetical protein
MTATISTTTISRDPPALVPAHQASWQPPQQNIMPSPALTHDAGTSAWQLSQQSITSSPTTPPQAYRIPSPSLQSPRPTIVVPAAPSVPLHSGHLKASPPTTSLDTFSDSLPTPTAGIREVDAGSFDPDTLPPKYDPAWQND